MQIGKLGPAAQLADLCGITVEQLEEDPTTHLRAAYRRFHPDAHHGAPDYDERIEAWQHFKSLRDRWKSRSEDSSS